MFGRWSPVTSIVQFALAVLVAAVALNLAARLIAAALPVLIPVGVVALIGFGLWRWRNPRGW